ncbi:MAG TPA: DUF4384 domain-containing protein [Gemmatimonadales bacterium]
MTSTLLLTLLAAAAAAAQAPPTDASSLRLTVWPRSFVRYGEPVRVTVDARRDGYLTVLRVDSHGRVHVLFPIDPHDDTFVEAEQTVTVRDRWGREAFAAFEGDGDGTVFAALAEESYDFSGYVARGRWSYALMGIRHAGDDHVASLVQLVEEMAGSDRFQYDFVAYTVTRFRPGIFAGQRGYAACYNYWNPGLFSSAAYGFDFGHPRGYRFLWSYADPHYDPFWYNPFLAEDLFFDPYSCYGARLIDYAPYYYGRPGRPGVVVDRGLKRKKGEVVKPIEPRRRDPGLRPTKTVRVVTDKEPIARRPRDNGFKGDGNHSWQPPQRRPVDREAHGTSGSWSGSGGSTVSKPVEKPAHKPVEKPAEKPREKP